MKSLLIAKIVGFIALSFGSAAIAVAADQPVSLQGDVKVEKTVTENGTERRVLLEPATVVPGDRLLFTTAYRNNGTAPVKDFVVTNPLPASVELVADATTPTVSVDGGKTWGTLGSLTVADGKGGRRPAQAGDVTHLRWVLATLAPGAAGQLSYHGVVR